MLDALMIAGVAMAVTFAAILLYMGFGAFTILVFNAYAEKAGCECGECDKTMGKDGMLRTIWSPWSVWAAMVVATHIGLKRVIAGKPFFVTVDDV